MKPFYFFSEKEYGESLENVLSYLKSKYKKIVVYKPIKEIDFANKITNIDIFSSYDNHSVLEKIINNESLVMKKIIQDYKALQNKYDFIFVVGSSKIDILNNFELNLKISKQLNLNIVIETSKNNEIYTQIAKKNGFEPVIFNGDCEVLSNIKQTSFLTPNSFEMSLVERAGKNKKTIVLPESNDERVLKAAQIIMDTGSVDLILLGDEEEILKSAKANNINLQGISIINNLNSKYLQEFQDCIYEARKDKGVSKEEAAKMAMDKNYFATMLVKLGYADGMVSGATCSTADTIRPALQLIKTKPGVDFVSGVFFMCLEDRVYVFADCAVNPNPTPAVLAQIAKITSDTAELFGINPNIAMLSYSTADSGKGVSVDIVKEALDIAKTYNINIDGPMQFDAAVDIKTAKSKMPQSSVAGNANVFIFPDLNSGNITYKAVQRTANTLAIGPVLQGLNKVVNDLSRGCLVEDIVNTVLISAIMA